VLPKHWVIERTSAWNLRARRLLMDHDRNPVVTQAWIWLAESRRLLRRLSDPADAPAAAATA
jgi:transposase